jgi:hypothetical protein
MQLIYAVRQFQNLPRKFDLTLVFSSATFENAKSGMPKLAEEEEQVFIS